MTQNNNLSVLPFYTSLEEQLRYKDYAYGDSYPLYTPKGCVPPFQIMIPHGSKTVTYVVLMRRGIDHDTQVVGNQLSKLTAAGMVLQRYTDYDIIVYPSMQMTDIVQEEGHFYLEVFLNDGTVYFSDVFTMVGQTSGMLCIQWYDQQDLIMSGCRLVYNTLGGAALYRNTLYLATQLGKPEYEFDEEGETRDGLFYAEKMISQKRYKCTILASEYLCDVMRFIRLSDIVTVRDQSGNFYHCNTFLMTPKWETQGNLASVEIEFTTNTVAKKIGSAVDFLAEFNDDYNNDYDNV